MTSKHRSTFWSMVACYTVAVGVYGWLVWKTSYPTRYYGPDLMAEWIRRAVANFHKLPHWAWPTAHLAAGILSWGLLLAPLFFHRKKAGQLLGGLAVGYIAILDLILYAPYM